MEATLITFLLGVENRAVEAVKSALYQWAWFKALDPNWQTPIIILIAALIGAVLAVVFGLNLLVSVPGVNVLIGEIVSGIALSFGSAGIQRLLDLIAALTAVQQQKAAGIQIANKAQAASAIRQP